MVKTGWISSFNAPSKSDVSFTRRKSSPALRYNYYSALTLGHLWSMQHRPRVQPQNNVESELISKNRVEPGRKVKALNKTVWESWPASTAANRIVLDKLHALTNPELRSLE